MTCPLYSWHYLAVFADGISYVPENSRRALDLKTGAGGGFAFSPDRKHQLISTAELRGDLYLLESFE